MCGTFADCTNLASLNLSGWNTNKIYDMQQMFSNCSSLTEIDLSGFKPDKIWGLYHTFYGCNYLEVIDLRNFHIANPDIVNKELTFKDCYRLHTLRLDNCDNTTIKTLIESTEFPTNPIAGVTRKIYCKKENAAGLTQPVNWKFEYIDEDAQ
jgi:surface protein